MFILASTDKLQITTSAVGTVHVHCSYVDFDGTSTYTPGRYPNQIISTATTTDFATAPSSSHFRTLKKISIVNAHATLSNTITVLHHDGTNAARACPVASLLPGESIQFGAEGPPIAYTASMEVKALGTANGPDPKTNDFRLSGVSATPVMTADNASLSTIYLAQFKGNRIGLYDGTYWQLAMPASEISLAVTGRTTDLPFDVFAYLSSGVVTLEFLDWSSATARATGLTRVDGVWTKTGDATRRYLGSCRARSATTFSWVIAGDGATTTTRFDLWNVDNRVDFGFRHIDSTDTWTYTTATVRQARGSTNNQVDVMVGLAEEIFSATLLVSSRNSTISIERNVGIGYDSTTTLTGTGAPAANTVLSINITTQAGIAHQPAIGRHFYAWQEFSAATGTCTWNGDNGVPARTQSGMTGLWTC